jgi:MFS family permease
MYLCYWYKPSERATRLAIFASSVAVAGAFSGLLATGISFLNGKANLAGWQWLFILTGIPAVLFGIVVWVWMPNFPQDAKFFTEEERAFAVARMGPFAPNKEDRNWDIKIAKKTLLDPLFWIYALSYFFMVNSLNSFSYFSPTIVANLGFSGYTAQLLTVPPNVFALLIIIGNCLHSDYSKERIRHALAGLVLVGTGYLLLALVNNWIGRYVAVFLIACTNAAVMPFLAHRTATVSGSTATALATGVTIAISNCGGISAPFLFPKTDGPNYPMGNVSTLLFAILSRLTFTQWTVFAMLCVTFLMTIYLGFRLGTSSEYRDFAPGAEEQLARVISLDGKIPDEARDSREFPPAKDQDNKSAVPKVQAQ